MEDVLVLGGTGFIGGRLCDRLLDKGYRVSVLNRTGRLSPFQQRRPTEILLGDRTDPASLESAVRGRNYDVVYDMIAYEPPHSELVARTFRGKIGRFIHCSTVSVYMVSDAVQCPIDESQDKTPLMPFWARNPFGMEYGIKKRQCEETLWAAHDDRLFPVTMLRPTYVSGPGDPMRRDFFWIERILDGGPLLVPGSGDIVFQQVFVDDVAKMFGRLLDVPASAGKAYNVVGEEILSLNEYLRKLGSLLGRNPDIVPIDQKVFDTLPFSQSPEGDVFSFNVRRTAVFSLDRIKRDIGYRSTRFDEWMGETIAWWTRPGRGHSTGYARRAEELAFLREYRGRGI